MVAVCVDGATGTYHPFPPSARLRLAGAHARDMRITRERMADEHDIVEFGAYRATFLIGNIHTLQHTTGTEPQSAFRELKLHRLRFHQTDTAICFAVNHF